MFAYSLLAAATLIACAPATLAASCPAPNHKPRLEIVVDDGPVAYDFRRTRQQLIELPRETGTIAPNHGIVPQGMTLAKVGLRISADVRYLSTRRGEICVYPEHIVLTVAADQRVFVDQRYREGSCEFRAVLDHELEHVRINRAASHAHEGELRDSIARLLTAHPFYVVRSSEQVRQVYLDRVNELAAPIMRVVSADANAHHAKLDSPTSYAATHARCQHW